MQQYVGKSTYHRYYNVKESVAYPGAIEIGFAQTACVILFPNDEFIIPRITELQNNDGAKCAMVCAMPYPVHVEKRRNGTFINDALWIPNGSHALRFNASGTCLNPPAIPEDNRELRKLFNKFMLKWQKQMSIVIKMSPNAVGNFQIYQRKDFHKVFMEPVFIDIYEQYIRPYYYGSATTTADIDIEEKMQHVKNFRKQYQDTLYREYLSGDTPVIHRWLVDSGFIDPEE